MKLNLKEININFSDIILYIFSIIVFLGVMTYSMVPFSGVLVNVRYGLIILLFGIAVVTQKYNLEQWIPFLIGLTITIISLSVSGIGIEYLFLMLAIFSVSTISPKKLLRYSASVLFVALFFLAICSWLKIIPNLIFYRNNAYRQSWGTIYPLTLAGYVFYTIAAWMAIQNKTSHLKQIVIIIISAVLVLKVTAGRNDTMAILLLLGVVIIDKLKDKNNKIILTTLALLTWIVCILSVFITTIVSYSSNLFTFFDTIFNHRLGLQYTLFQFYSPQMWGQLVPQVGAGGTNENVGYYFYIDNSYSRLLFMYGIALSIFLMILFIIFTLKLINVKAYKLAYIFLIVMISGIAEDSFINPVVNIFLYLLLQKKVQLQYEFEN